MHSDFSQRGFICMKYSLPQSLCSFLISSSDLLLSPQLSQIYMKILFLIIMLCTFLSKISMPKLNQVRALFQIIFIYIIYLI